MASGLYAWMISWDRCQSDLLLIEKCKNKTGEDSAPILPGHGATVEDKKTEEISRNIDQ